MASRSGSRYKPLGMISTVPRAEMDRTPLYDVISSPSAARLAPTRWRATRDPTDLYARYPPSTLTVKPIFRSPRYLNDLRWTVDVMPSLRKRRLTSSASPSEDVA